MNNVCWKCKKGTSEVGILSKMPDISDKTYCKKHVPFKIRWEFLNKKKWFAYLLMAYLIFLHMPLLILFMLLT